MSPYSHKNNQLATSLATYDGAGNVIQDTRNAYAYDPEGRLCAVEANPTGSATYTQYIYDAEGRRVAKGSGTSLSCGAPTTANGFTLSSQYLLDQSGNQASELGASGNWVHSNIWEGGRLTGTYTSTGLHFAIADPLGTKRVQAVVTSSGTGAPELNCLSLPFGNNVGNTLLSNCVAVGSGGTDATEHHFTGKERDTESGNDYFGARYYASSMGRFMSPDPGPWQLENPQYLNMYNYALNNPLRYTDAEGETPQDRVLKAIQLTTQNIPYKSGGHSEATGLDCSGLVADVWKSDPDSVMNLSVNGPGGGAANEASEFQNNGAGQWSTDINSAQPGDAIFFANDSGTIVHTGIVVDIRDGKVYFVHAPKPGEKVKPYYIKINNPKLGGEKFAGLGRSIENGQSSTSNSSKPNAWQRFTNWVSSLFSDQPPAEPQAKVSATSCATGPDGKVTCQ